MAPNVRNKILQTVGVVAMVTSGASLCGDAQPSHIRTATIGGVRGPVYYSVVDGAFHSIGRSIPRHAAQQMAEVAVPRP